MTLLVIFHIFRKALFASPTSVMRKIYTAILFFVTSALADDAFCQSLYEDLMDALEIQLTALCETQTSDVFSFRFHLRDQDGFHNMALVFSNRSYHLYMEGEDNPYKCDNSKAIYRTQKPEEIARILFIPREDCSEAFKKSIGIEQL